MFFINFKFSITRTYHAFATEKIFTGGSDHDPHVRLCRNRVRPRAGR